MPDSDCQIIIEAHRRSYHPSQRLDCCPSQACAIRASGLLSSVGPCVESKRVNAGHYWTLLEAPDMCLAAVTDYCPEQSGPLNLLLEYYSSKASYSASWRLATLSYAMKLRDTGMPIHRTETPITVFPAVEGGIRVLTPSHFPSIICPAAAVPFVVNLSFCPVQVMLTA